MKTSIYSRHRFHPDIIRKTIWLYFRFNMSFRDIEDMMAERGVDVYYETTRRRVRKHKKLDQYGQLNGYFPLMAKCGLFADITSHANRLILKYVGLSPRNFGVFVRG